MPSWRLKICHDMSHRKPVKARGAAAKVLAKDIEGLGDLESFFLSQLLASMKYRLDSEKM